MELIQLLLAAIILGMVYKKMLRWEVGVGITRKQALLPIGLGVLSTILSVACTIGIGYNLMRMGYNLTDIQNPLTKALAMSWLRAGLTEECAKFIMILLSIKVLKPKNVYECALIGGAVGFGFTLHEELLYGGNAAGILRFICVATHMALGIIMGKYLGLVKYRKAQGLACKSQYMMAMAVPMLIHTIYDALTIFNPAVTTEGLDEDIMAVWALTGVAIIICAFIFQIVVIKRLKREADAYSEMNVC